MSDISLPKYDNRRNENPFQHLKELGNFLDLILVSEKSKLLVNKNLLFGHFASWNNMYTGIIISYTNFKGYFLRTVLRKIRNMVTNGVYNFKKDGYMCNPFIQMAQMAKFVDVLIYLPRKFISLETNHFPCEMHSA